MNKQERALLSFSLGVIAGYLMDKQEKELVEVMDKAQNELSRLWDTEDGNG